MNCQEFKANDALSLGWKKELDQNTLLKTALTAVITDSPLNKVVDNRTETEALINHGKILGYEEAVRNLFDLASLTKLPEQLRATYGVKQPTA